MASGEWGSASRDYGWIVDRYFFILISFAHLFLFQGVGEWGIASLPAEACAKEGGEWGD